MSLSAKYLKARQDALDQYRDAYEVMLGDLLQRLNALSLTVPTLHFEAIYDVGYHAAEVIWSAKLREAEARLKEIAEALPPGDDPHDGTANTVIGPLARGET